MTPPRRILLIRPSALGDVCRTVPVLASLKRWAPDARIDWLVQDAFAPAVAAHPDLHAVVPFPRTRFRNWWRSPTVARELWAWLGALRRTRYDMVFDCQGLARSGLFAWCTRAPARVGYANAQEWAWLGVNRRHDAPRDAHTVDRMLALVEAEGVPAQRDMRLYTSEEDRRAVPDSLRGARYAVVAPTSRWEAKRWPDARFAALVRALLDDGGFDRVAVVGGPGERAQCPETINACAQDERIIDLIGATGVGGLMAAIESSSLVVANDSAALHMAVGFDRPYVGLFGPTQLSLVGPYGGQGVTLQRVEPDERPNHKAPEPGRTMMARITLEDVLAGAAEARRLRTGTVTTANAPPRTP
ncbi:MAG: glycosyltransferase family 9 protein [Phycisphaerales bacterium]|nr:MAG: glycosyltransferase family 9 protein [Phycisphaerales bacterium]